MSLPTQTTDKPIWVCEPLNDSKKRIQETVQAALDEEMVKEWLVESTCGAWFDCVLVVFFFVDPSKLLELLLDVNSTIYTYIYIYKMSFGFLSRKENIYSTSTNHQFVAFMFSHIDINTLTKTRLLCHFFWYYFGKGWFCQHFRFL